MLYLNLKWNGWSLYVTHIKQDMTIWFGEFIFKFFYFPPVPQVYHPDGCQPGLSRPPLPLPRQASPCWRSAVASRAPSCSLETKQRAPLQGRYRGHKPTCSFHRSLYFQFQPFRLRKTLRNGWSNTDASRVFPTSKARDVAKFMWCVTNAETEVCLVLDIFCPFHISFFF